MKNHNPIKRSIETGCTNTPFYLELGIKDSDKGGENIIGKDTSNKSQDS